MVTKHEYLRLFRCLYHGITLIALIFLAGCASSVTGSGVADNGSTTNNAPPPSPTPSPTPPPPPPAPPPVGSAVVDVQLVDQSGSVDNDIPLTFGQVFAPGHIPAGAHIVARTTGPGAVAVPIQVDRKATNSDGSLRHAVITLRLPTLSANGSQTVELVSSNTPPAASGTVSISDLLATSFDAVVSAHVDGVDYSVSARSLLAAGGAKTWLSGPLVTEWMVASPFMNGSTAHPHLAARFNVRAYRSAAGGPVDSVRVSVVVENDWAYEPNPRNFVYDVSVSIGGSTVYQKTGLTHYRQARWRKVFWWGRQPHVLIKHNRAYLFASGAVPNYDQSLVIPESALANMTWSGPSTEPMGSGYIYQYFPATGGRPDIGPLPRWAARYLLSMDGRAKNATLGNGDQAGSFNIHYRDRSTGLPVSLIDHPYMSLLASNPNAMVNPSTGKSDAFPACAGDCSTPFTVDSAHQPSLAYVPYLVTGDYYYLEELQFWANWNMLQAVPSDRDESKGLITWDQGRGQAWSLRTLAQAAYITPDDDPLKSYFVDRVNYNLDDYNTNYTNNPNAPALGFTVSGFSLFSSGEISPWNDDAITMVAGFLADMGFSKAVSFRNWKVKFVHGRFSNDPVFCRHDAAAYRMMVQRSDGSFISTWSELMSASFPGDVGNCPATYAEGSPNDPESYLAITQGALAAAVAAGYTDARSYISDVKQSLISAGADIYGNPEWMITAR